jgi:8-oxo-dGTP diphosphatase
VHKQFSLIEDRYDGVTIDGSCVTYTALEFEAALRELLQSLQNKKLLWIKLAIERSELIPVLTTQGFVFHHCNLEDITLVKKIVEHAIIPTAVNHTLGVGAVVLHHDNLLVIKDRIHQTYKLPGGFIDDGEHISQAIVREVFEETGIEVAFESVVSLGHFTPAQFGESNLYVIALAKPQTTDIDIKDKDEILEARWINVSEYLEREDVLPYNKAIVNKALTTIKGLQIDNDIELHVRAHTQYELFF